MRVFDDSDCASPRSAMSAFAELLFATGNAPKSISASCGCTLDFTERTYGTPRTEPGFRRWPCERGEKKDVHGGEMMRGPGTSVEVIEPLHLN